MRSSTRDLLFGVALGALLLSALRREARLLARDAALVDAAAAIRPRAGREGEQR